MIDHKLDAEYNARESVPDFDIYPALYRELSSAAYDTIPSTRGVRYGDGPDEDLDVFPQHGAPSPVLVFIHGGYWRALSKEDSAFVALQLHKDGAVVVVLGYSLAPAASLDLIVDQIRRAVTWLSRNVETYGGDPRRIVVAGHSAGGQLAGMLLSDDWQLFYGAPSPAVSGVLSLSGLFDLRPLLHTHINDWMNLDTQSAERNSPALHLPESDPRPELVVTYGEYESPAFASQSLNYLASWSARGGAGRHINSPARNHFDVVTDLQLAGSPSHQAALGLLGLGQPADHTLRDGK